ncbi:MAG TPA: beta-ketoacyl synthase N-terminal-like domain-containing protein [Bryobacteraceae bacterium]|nr:beta-ketoacyl synthase N-terminal-like domain-containing protein [Bryobacteraceae bacterium]
MRFGVFGWGIVAPKSPNIGAFTRNLSSSESWLSPFNGFGPDNFLAGIPEFRFEDYKEWIDGRFAPRQYQTLKEKMDLPTLYAIGAFIQSLGQNPELEGELKALGSQAHVYIGTGLGSLDTVYTSSVKLYEAQRRWDRFWSDPRRNEPLRQHLAQSPETGDASAPPHPDSVCEAERDAAEAVWNRYWMEQSPELRRYLAELARIDGLSIEGDIASGKLNAIREKEKRRAKLQEEWQTPEPPWRVSANLIWNIHNTPAAQVSILGKIRGLAFAPVAACSTFGVALKLAMRAIACGDAKVVVVGATDPPPHPLTVGSFYSARVLSADRSVSVPLTRLQGTHVAGGSVVWIVGDLEYCKSKGFRPLGMEPLSVGLSSDAHHIITPTAEGPWAAMQQALTEGGATPCDMGTWDLHATATPGDYSEVAGFRSIFPNTVVVTARKGTFGHGMGAGGGWELTAQYLGYEAGHLYPTPLSEAELNQSIAGLHSEVVFDEPRAFPPGLGGKLSMGIGGINACVISRPWGEETAVEEAAHDNHRQSAGRADP